MKFFSGPLDLEVLFCRPWKFYFAGQVEIVLALGAGPVVTHTDCEYTLSLIKTRQKAKQTASTVWLMQVKFLTWLFCAMFIVQTPQHSQLRNLPRSVES